MTIIWIGCLMPVAFARRVLADAAPPPPVSGSDLYPSIGNTNVRMMSEYVQLDMGGNNAATSEEMVVTVQFFMRNWGETTEQMMVRFPLAAVEYNIEWAL